MLSQALVRMGEATKIDHMNDGTAPFTLEQVLVTPARNEIEAEGKNLRLQPKVMEVLVYLAAHQDRVIPNDELTEQLWQGRVVTHGSVQKSINLLRKSLAQLLGDRDIITHYSKRGYQLQITPTFLDPETSAPPVSSRQRRSLTLSGFYSRLMMAAGALILIVSVTGVYLVTHWHTLFIDKSYRTEFSAVVAYTGEEGHEHGGEPHPNGRHLAYIKEWSKDADAIGAHSHLVIRNDGGQDWYFADAAGGWLELSWSPTGRQLAAIERIRDDDDPATPDFFSTTRQMYNVHVFALDVENSLVVEKHRLSQWQGSINSVTWWNEDVVELVAKQGDAVVNRRYRYSLGSQRLDVVSTPDPIANPLLTRVYNQRTAVVSLHNATTRLDFLAPNQMRFASHRLPYRVTDLSWLPDGSGVLVYSADDERLEIVYRDTDRQAIEFPQASNTRIVAPRFSVNRQRIYFGEQRSEAELWIQALNGTESILPTTGYMAASARFSPRGDSLAYVSVRDNQPQIWLIQDGAERLVLRHQTGGSISDLVWSQDGEHLAFKGGASLYLHNLARGRSQVLWQEAYDLEPVAVLPEQNGLLVLRTFAGATNLWHLDYAGGEERQLTFGAVGSATELGGDSYFQYAGQSRLWVKRQGIEELEVVARRLEQNSKILQVDDEGVYYITGGECRESDIFYLGFSEEETITYQTRDNSHINTASFHPERGALYTPCHLPESNIMVLE